MIHLRSNKGNRAIVDHYTIEGIKVKAISLPYSDALGHGLTALNIEVYKVIARFLVGDVLSNCDVIHSCGANHAGVVASFFAKSFKKRHIAQFIGTDINFVLPRIYNRFGVKGWEKTVDVMVANSEGLKKEVTKYYQNDARVVYRGVELDKFQATESRSTRSEIRFLYLGGLSPRNGNPHGMNLKGGIDLLKAWKEALNREDGKKSSKLYFGGPDVNASKVEDLLEGSLMDYGIEVLGNIPMGEVKNLYHMVDVVIVPSMAEGLPNVAMEASSSECMVVASDAGGIPEAVMHGETGLIYEKGNYKQLLQILEAIMLENEDPLEYGRRGRKLMEEKFDSSNFASNYQKIYEGQKGL